MGPNDVDLIKEERWVPVAESGERWVGRPKEKANDCLISYPAGGKYLDGEPWDGVTHIERETRFVTEWKVANDGASE